MFAIMADPRDAATTFARPGEGRGFLSSAVDIMTDPAERDRLADVFSAADRNQAVVDNTFSREAAIDEATEKRIEAIRKATGVTLQNPRHQALQVAAEGMDLGDPGAFTQEAARAQFDRRLAELAEQYPDLRGIIRPDVPVEEDARALARDADAGLRTAQGEAGPAAALLGSLGGAMWGSFRDPLQVATLFAGGGAGTAGKVAMRVGQVALREALYNAGAVAIMQPAVQSWREEAGLRSGIMPALENVGLAALFGGIIGGGIQGAREIPKALRGTVQKALDGTATPRELAEAGRALDLDPEVQRGLDMAAESADLDAVAVGRVPDGVAPDLDADLTAAALRHAEDPVNNPAPAAIIAYHNAEPSPIQPVVDKVRAMGSPMDVVTRYLDNPDAVHASIDEIIDGIRAAEKSLKAKYRVKNVEDLEDAPLTKAESDFLFYGQEPTTVDFWRDMSEQLQPVDSLREAAQELAYEFKRLPRDLEKLSRQDQLTIARLQVLFAEVQRLGGDLNEVIKEAGSRYGARFDDPEDAIFMAQNAAEGLRAMMADRPPPPAEALALPAPRNPAIEQRIAEARPQSLAEEQRVVAEAMEEIGTRNVIAANRASLDEPVALRRDAEGVPIREPFEEPADAPKRAKGDVFDKVPLARDDGTVAMAARAEIAKVGERDTMFADLVRSCK